MFEVYPLVLFVHIAAAVALVGHSLGSPITRAALREAATHGDLARIAALERGLSRFIPLSALILLASGLYLGSVGWWSYGWFYLSIGGWLVNSLLGGLVIKPVLARLASATPAVPGAPVPPDLDAVRRSTKFGVAGQVMLANNVALLLVMVMKPSFLASAAVFLVANAVLAGLALAPRRSQPAALAERRLEA